MLIPFKEKKEFLNAKSKQKICLKTLARPLSHIFNRIRYKLRSIYLDIKLIINHFYQYLWKKDH